MSGRDEFGAVARRRNRATPNEARTGWGPIRGLGSPRRFVPVFRCARHAQNPPPGYTTEILTREDHHP